MINKNTSTKQDWLQLLRVAGMLVWIIPALLVPIAIIIFFTKERNVWQCIAIIAFAAGLTAALKGILALAKRAVEKSKHLQ